MTTEVSLRASDKHNINKILNNFINLVSNRIYCRHFLGTVCTSVYFTEVSSFQVFTQSAYGIIIDYAYFPCPTSLASSLTLANSNLEHCRKMI